jgi:hypothetical protein
MESIETKNIQHDEPPLEKSGTKVVGKMSGKDYWEWRATLTEVDLEKEKTALTEHKFVSMQKDIEIAQLKRQIFIASMLEPQRVRFQKVKNDADEWRKALEARLGIELRGCIIDDVTFEVKTLEEN